MDTSIDHHWRVEKACLNNTPVALEIIPEGKSFFWNSNAKPLKESNFNKSSDVTFVKLVVYRFSRFE